MYRGDEYSFSGYKKGETGLVDVRVCINLRGAFCESKRERWTLVAHYRVIYICGILWAAGETF